MPCAKKSGFPRILAIATSLAVAVVIVATGPGNAQAVPAGIGAAASSQPLPSAAKKVELGIKAMAAKAPDAPKPSQKAPAKYELGFIVNKDHKLSPSYKPALKTIPGTSKQLTPEAVAAFTKMRKAARKDGIALTAVSGYRSYARQKALFAYYSRKLGAKQAARVSARPGTSEHQTGLAMDVGASNGRCVISKCFANTREGKWVAKNAHKYGFIMRYPKGGEKITGYDFEPWHFRYVGPAIAKGMKNKKIQTLEQYYTS